MTTAGSFLTNGALPAVFGSSPIAGGGPFSALSSLGTVLGGNGLSMSTLAETVSGLVGNSTGQSWFSGLTDTLSSMAGSALDFSGPMKDAWNQLATSPAAGGGTVFGALTGTWSAGPAQFLSSVVGNDFNTAIQQGVSWASQTLGGSGNLIGGSIIGDAKKLGSIFSAAESFASSANSLIGAAANSAEYLNKTFTSMENVITGGVDGVSKWFDGFGGDISKLGNTISWENLSNLGSPGQLLANLENSGTLGPLYNKIGDIVVDPRTAQQLGVNLSSVLTGQGQLRLKDLGIDINQIARQGADLPPGIQKEIYNTFDRLNPTELSQVKGILRNTQGAVTKGSDLLNPQKLFGSSFTTLTTPLRTGSVGFRAIYENESGSINPELNDLGQDLKGIIPDDLAVANAALNRSLQQIKGISNTTTETLAASISRLETLKDLPDIADQQQYVTEPVIEYWQNYYGQDYGLQLATGNNNTLTVSDVIGFAAGYNSGLPLTENTQLLTTLNDAGAFTDFTQTQGIYETIQTFCTGIWTAEDPMMPGDWYTTIPVGWAAAGIYGPFATAEEAFEDAWLNGIIPVVAVASVDVYDLNPEAQTAYDNEVTWQTQYGREYLNRQKADLNVTEINPSDQSALSLAQSLPNLGVRTEFAGPAMWFERVSNATSVGGQGIVAAMREGRNILALNEAGIVQDASVPSETPPYPGTLATNTLTKEEANALVIRS